MSLIVQKYGGTSVGSIERIRNVARRVARYHREGHDLVVVVSAMSGETNRLLGLARELSPNPDPRELDVVAATGEQVTIGLLAIALHELGVKAKSYTGGQVRIVTDSAFTKARILSIDEAPMRADLAAGTVVIVAGFQGIDADGNITTLGRGGSDTSGVALAAALKADECQIYTDVDGVYTTDPRIVPEARRLDTITFEEMLEMASLGSKVLQIRSVEFAGKYKVKLRVLSSFEDPESTSKGTLITFEEDEAMEQAIISGIAFTRDEAKISVMGVEDKPGVAYAILGPIADANIDVDMIVQNIGASGHTDFSFTVNRSEYQKALDVLSRERGKVFKAREIIGDNRICKVSAIGIGMRSHTGIAVEDVQGAVERGHQHPDDLDLRDQDLRRDRREVPRARGARAAQRLRAGPGAEGCVTIGFSCGFSPHPFDAGRRLRYNGARSTETWPSGRRHSPAKGAYAQKGVSRVRIPASPPAPPAPASLAELLDALRVELDGRLGASRRTVVDGEGSGEAVRAVGGELEDLVGSGGSGILDLLTVSNDPVVEARSCVEIDGHPFRHVAADARQRRACLNFRAQVCRGEDKLADGLSARRVGSGDQVHVCDVDGDGAGLALVADRARARIRGCRERSKCDGSNHGHRRKC